MTFQQFLLVLRAHWKAVIGTLIVIVGGTILVSLVLPRKYTAVSTIVVDVKGVDPVLGVMLPVQMLPGYINTQIEIIKSHKVALEVVRATKLTDNPAAKTQWLEATGGLGEVDDWFADLLRESLEVEPSKESGLVDISFTATDPRFAAIIANAFTDAYQSVNLELRVEPAKQAAGWFNEQITTLTGNLERAQANLATYQREKGIHSSDERLDVESARLGELSQQLSAAQGVTFDLQSRQRQLREFIANGASAETLPDVLSNPLIQGMKSALAQNQGQLEQISSQLGSNHPQVQRLRAEIKGQHENLRLEIDKVSAAINNSASIAEKRERELRNALAEQKARLLRLNQGRDEMAVLMKEVEAAQRAYEAASQRFTQTNLESQTTLTNIAVLNRAIPPVKPSSPRKILNTILALGIGSFLAVGLALLLELFDRRVRSEADLLVAFDVPLLGRLDRATGSGRSRSLSSILFRRPVAPAAG